MINTIKSILVISFIPALIISCISKKSEDKVCHVESKEILLKKYKTDVEVCSTFYENNKIKSIYLKDMNGNLVDKYVDLYPNGKPKKIGYYYEGLPYGRFDFIDSSGQLYNSKFYVISNETSVLNFYLEWDNGKIDKKRSYYFNREALYKQNKDSVTLYFTDCNPKMENANYFFVGGKFDPFFFLGDSATFFRSSITLKDTICLSSKILHEGFINGLLIEKNQENTDSNVYFIQARP